MKRVLTVDDSATVRQVLTMTLAGAGYEVVEAVDGDDGLQKIEENAVDLLITDLHMPGLNGLQLSEKVRSMQPYRFLPIVMLTTEDKEEMKQAGKEIGVSGWIVKPFKPAQLLDFIRKLCPA